MYVSLSCVEQEDIHIFMMLFILTPCRCEGVKAAMSNVNHQSPLENWIRNIRSLASAVLCLMHANALVLASLMNVPVLATRMNMSVIATCMNMSACYIGLLCKRE